MQPPNNTLVAAAVAAVIVLAYWYWASKRGCSCGGTSGRGCSCDGFTAAATKSPYALLHKQLDQLRGRAHGPAWRKRPGWQHHRATATPEQLAEAERGQWYAATAADGSGEFNSELTGTQDATAQYQSAQPAIDYNSMTTDLIVDPQMRANHKRWVEEMRPWSGTAMMVDDLDEAMEAGTHFHGLRRPQPVVQHNPLQLTENDTSTLAANRRFNFMG